MITNDGSDESMLRVVDDYNKKITLIRELEVNIESAIASLYRNHGKGHNRTLYQTQTEAWCHECQALESLTHCLKLISEKS